MFAFLNRSVFTNPDRSSLMKASVNRGGFLGQTTKPQAEDIRRIQALYGAGTGVAIVTTLSEKTLGNQVEVFEYFAL